MNRIKVLKESKFERMTREELRATKGGMCFSCKRRSRTIELGLHLSVDPSGWTTRG